MADIVVHAEIRDTRGKNEARRLRAKGLVPGVVYGEGREARPVYLAQQDVMNVLHSPKGTNTLFKIQQKEAGGKERLVMIRDYQFHPVSGSLLHVDLVRIDTGKKLAFKVPVHTTGLAPGIKNEGGILTVVMHELHLRCFPDRIPDHITIDLSHLNLHDVVRVRDVDFGPDVEPMDAPELPILQIAEPMKEPTPEELAAAEAVTLAEPEVIGRGKKEEEGAEGAAAAEGKEGAKAEAKGKGAEAKEAGKPEAKKGGREEKKPPKDKK